MSTPVLCRRICALAPEPLARAATSDPSAGDLEAMCGKINRLSPAPLVPVTPDDVVIYSALVANDLVDSYSTRFSVNALGQIAERIVGVPGLRNHSTWGSSDLPVLRWFDGAQTERNGIQWARGWFYMSASPDDVDARMIEARSRIAVLREVSLSWWQDGLRCSICGKDMWAMDDEGHYVCMHNPGQSYNGVVCIGEMDSIKEVAEASLVWKGGQYGTELEMPGARVEQQEVETLAQRIASKRSTMPALAGEESLAAYFGSMVGPSALDWLTAGLNAAQEE